MLSTESGEMKRGDITESLHTSLLSVPSPLKVMGSQERPVFVQNALVSLATEWRVD